MISPYIVFYEYIYLMQAFINKEYKSADLKCLNFVLKYIQAISLANISTIDGCQISHQVYKAEASKIPNNATNYIHWPLETSSHQILYQLRL